MADVTPPPAIKTVPKPRDQHLRDMADCIRFLSMDAVQNAKSGHPGAPMGMADIATVLFKDFMQFDAADPHWFDRDRFILSNGHGSMLLYSLLYLTGYKDMTLDELKRFRQVGSKTAGQVVANDSQKENLSLNPPEASFEGLFQMFGEPIGTLHAPAIGPVIGNVVAVLNQVEDHLALGVARQALGMLPGKDAVELTRHDI